MARKTQAAKDVRYTYLATEFVDNITRGGDLERSLVRDFRELDDSERAKTLEYAVKAMLVDRKEEVMASLARQLEELEKKEATEKADKSKTAAKAEALTRLVTHARIRSKAKRIVRGRGK